MATKRKSSRNKLRFKAQVMIAFIEGMAFLEITPQDWHGGVFLSRFYAVYEDSQESDVYMAGFGPVLANELDAPSTIWVHITPSTRKGKRTLKLVTNRPLPEGRKPKPKGAQEHDL